MLRLRLGLTALAVLAAAVLLSAPAQASAPVPGCPAGETSQPFLWPWLDPAHYELAPGGDIEDGTATWTLQGGAAAVEGNERFKVGGATDHVALRLPPGSSATTAPMCIGPEHLWTRFFARRGGGLLLLDSTLLVETVVTDAAGAERTRPIGVIHNLGFWRPTLPLPIVENLLTQGGTLQVAFRFTPLGGAPWTIDDVYVDPFRTG